MTIRADQTPHVSVSEVRNFAVSWKDLLETGETVSSSCFTEVSTSDLTLGTSTVNSSAHVIGSATCSSGQATLVTASGWSADTKYTLLAKAITSASQTLLRHLQFWSE